jgi:predicted nucleotidyltransferase
MTDLHPSQRYSAKNDPVVTAFAQRVRSRLGLKVRDLRLFGSRARGDAHRYSDYDMLVVVDHKTPAIRSEILEIEVGLLDEYDVLVTSVVRSENEWQISQGYPLARNITREGILL